MATGYTVAEAEAMLSLFVAEAFGTGQEISAAQAESVLALGAMDTVRAVPGDALKSLQSRFQITLQPGHDQYGYPAPFTEIVRVLAVTLTYDGGQTYKIATEADHDDLAAFEYNPWLAPDKDGPRYMTHYGTNESGTAANVIHIWPTPVAGDSGNITIDGIPFEKTLSSNTGFLDSTLVHLSIPRAAEYLCPFLDMMDRAMYCQKRWLDGIVTSFGALDPKFKQALTELAGGGA